MILIDTSVWADHFRRDLPEIGRLAVSGEVVHHPFVTGELAMGNPADRTTMIEVLAALPQAKVVDARDFLAFIERTRIFGTGLGFVDAHLLAAAHAGEHRVWSSDKRLIREAARLGLSHET